MCEHFSFRHDLCIKRLYLKLSDYFHWLSPLGRVSLAVAMSVCLCVCLMSSPNVFFPLASHWPTLVTWSLSSLNYFSAFVSPKHWRIAKNMHSWCVRAMSLRWALCLDKGKRKMIKANWTCSRQSKRRHIYILTPFLKVFCQEQVWWNLCININKH